MENARRRGVFQIVGLLVAFVLPILLSCWGLRGARALRLVATANGGGWLLVVAAANWATLAVVALLMRPAGLKFREIGLGRPELRHFVAGFFFFLLGVGLFYLVLVLAAKVAPGACVRGMAFHLAGWRTWPIVVFAALLTMPVCQEILYRGYAIKVMGDRLGSYWAGGVVSCIVFGLVHLPHFGTVGAVALTVWSVLPMFLFIWMRSVYPGMVMHFLNNLWAFILLRLILPELFLPAAG